MTRRPCCKCGTILAVYGKPPRQLSLCPSCWHGMDQAEIVRRSHAHDAGDCARCGSRPVEVRS